MVPYFVILKPLKYVNENNEAKGKNLSTPGYWHRSTGTGM